MIWQQIHRLRDTLSAFRSLTSLAWHARQGRLRTGPLLAKSRCGPRRRASPLRGEVQVRNRVGPLQPDERPATPHRFGR